MVVAGFLEPPFRSFELNIALLGSELSVLYLALFLKVHHATRLREDVLCIV